MGWSLWVGRGGLVAVGRSFAMSVDLCVGQLLKVICYGSLAIELDAEGRSLGLVAVSRAL